MKTITLDEMAKITQQMFDKYVEPVAMSFMSGEVPSTTFAIHRKGSKDKDWLAKVRFKNTLTISMFRCDVYLDDIMRLCRECKMYLVTREVFYVAVTFAMLYPLYETQYMDFTHNVNTDFDSMMAGANQATFKFMRDHFEFTDDIQQDILRLLYYKAMTFINNYKHAPRHRKVGEVIEDLQMNYDYYMNTIYALPYKTAKYFKAQTNLLDSEGFIRLEPKTPGSTHYTGKAEAENNEEVIAKFLEENEISKLQEDRRNARKANDKYLIAAAEAEKKEKEKEASDGKENAVQDGCTESPEG